MVACPKCGVKLPGSLSVCPRDGTVLQPESTRNRQDIAEEETAGPSQQSSTKPLPDPKDKDPSQEKYRRIESEGIDIIRNGAVIDNRYEIISLLGMGAMGSVYKARHTVLGTIFAIKMVHPQIISEESFQRFKLEARAVSQLNHPGIISIHDFGLTPEGIPYLAMEYLEGRPLSAVLKQEGALKRAQFFEIFEQVAAALSHAHKQGIIHRDLKPANIVICRSSDSEPKVKILDFGMAKFLPRDNEPLPDRITATGEVLGSPLYMSPEQCRGAELDARTDIYSLGIVMHESLTSSHLFWAESPSAVMHQHINESPEFATSPTLSGDLEKLILKCLEKERELRYQTAEELRADLERLSKYSGEGADQKPVPEGLSQPASLPGRTFSRSLPFVIIAIVITALLLVVFIFAGSRH